jgi:hypothetical protein
MKARNGLVTVAKDPGEVIPVEAIKFSNNGVEETAKTQAFVRRDRPETLPNG